MVLVLLTNRSDRGRGTFALFIVQLAVSPVLASSIFALLGRPPLPWLVALSGTLYFRYTAVLAAATGLTYLLTRGDNAKKARWALGCFTILSAALFAFIWPHLA